MTVLYLVEQGSTLHKRGHLLVVTKQEQTLAQVPARKVEQVVVLGHVNLTTPAMVYLLQTGTDVVFCSQHGRYYGRLLSRESRFGELRHRQLLAYSDPAGRLALARAFVAGKLRNQRRLLEPELRALPPVPHPGDAAWRAGTWPLPPAATARPAAGATPDVAVVTQARARMLGRAVAGLRAVEAQVARGETALEVLRGLEGHATALYFAGLRATLGEPMGFARRVRRPPTDPVNSLLSFGYTLLAYELEAAVRTVGLDPYIGFLHLVHYSRPSLALDLMEEFRPVLVDALVLRLVNERVLTAADFTQDSEGGGAVLLTDDGRRLFLQHYEERVQTRVPYGPARERLSCRRVFEQQARAVARVILGEAAVYQPVPLDADALPWRAAPEAALPSSAVPAERST